MKRIFFLMFLSLLILNLVSAVPPITTTQQFTEGYDIQVPQDNILKVNEDYEFEFHVMNISNGVPITTGISCFFHIYNSTGQHVVEMIDNTASETFDYSFTVLKENFSKIENMYYYVSCNSTYYGGFGESIIYVTPSGFINTLGFYFLILILSLGIIFLGFNREDPTTVLLGTFGLYFVGFYILFNGIDGIKDTVYTWGISIITLAFAFYLSTRSSFELIND